MNYQLVNWQQNGSVRDNGDNTSTIPIIVTTGVVGDTYGFIRNDATSYSFTNTQTATQIKEAGTLAAANFVTQKYPTT